jgi:hypothetical protein
MSNLQDEILLNDYALNQDDDYRYLPKGSAPYALNLLKSEDGSGYIITNLKGNRKVTYVPPTAHPLLDANVYFTLCSCYDPLTRNVYYWIFTQPVDTSGSGDYEYDNRLLRFNEETEIIDTIFVDYVNYFGLDPLKPFKDSFVLGTWLYFNPRESEPKMIDIDMAYNYTNYNAYDSTLTYVYGQKVTYFGGLFMALDSVAADETPVNTTAKWERIGDCYQDETNFEIYYDSEFRYAFNVIKLPPIPKITFSWGSDTDRAVNDLTGLIFRFAARYKYFDNTYSKYSAFSDITLSPSSEQYNGDITNITTTNNYLALIIPLHSPSLVSHVEVVFQTLGGDWKLAEIIRRQDIDLLPDSYFIYNFYNDGSYPAIDDTDIFENQDAVPQKANCQEIINKNILCYAGCTEGFDNLPKEDIDVSLTPEPIEFVAADYQGTTVWDNIAEGDLTEEVERETDPTLPDYGSILYTYADIDMSDAFSAGLSAGDYYKIRIGSQEFVYRLSDSDDDSVQDLVAGLATAITQQFEHTAIVNPSDDTKLRIDSGYTAKTVDVSMSIFFNAGAGSNLVKQRGFKTGAWHPFCMFYYDSSLRRWDAQTSKENLDGTAAWEILGTTVYVPMLGEYSPTLSGLNYKWYINWKVNHQPPEGAKFWRWGYAGNSLCSYFVRYIIGSEDGVSIDDSAADGTEPLNTVFIDITPLQTLTNSTTSGWNTFPNSIIKPYSYVKGDRIRFITEKSDAIANEIGDTLDGMYDFEILGEDKTINRIYIQDFDYSGAGIGKGSMVEIYSPLKGDKAIQYYEFGELMPVLEDINGDLVHGAASSGDNQVYATNTPATGTFTAGDVYHILRTPSLPINLTEGYIHESMWYSDFYDSDDWDRGKHGYETLFGQRFLNVVRYSNQYLQNTMINGLSAFRGSNYVELNDIYGDILRIIENGDTLKVYQRKKPSSFLIGKTQYYDAEGNPNVQAVSDRVLSLTPRYSTTNYGTEYPESIERNNRYIYGFDVYNGVLWRDSPNGIFPISGRYEDADGGGDYKMETYFKAKAKALLVDGIENTQVLITWDERHKNLYVVFKDNVNADNDEAIIFHEPSNKWICFTDMDYTPAEGWGQILELDYWVLSGFEGGIGFEFDNDTRFAVFDIETGGGADVFIEGTLIVDEDGTTYIVTDSGEYIIE